jgi:SAM-dependent methyltransferase
VASGIPLMLHPDLPGAREKLREVEGWVAKARAEEWYEPDDDVDRVLPFPNRKLGWDDLGWLANGHSFEVLLDRYAGRGVRVLEVGAGKAWAAPYWLERDCEYVASDILVDANIGLGRGAFYGDFARVQADGENLPFADRSFDVTYTVAALHHALDMPRMLREMARVTKHGGVVAGLNEGIRGVRRPDDNPEQEGEKALGINEHVHTPWAYVTAFTRAGLVIRRLERPDGLRPRPYGTLLSQIPKIGPSLGAFVHLSGSHYGGISIYARRR